MSRSNDSRVVLIQTAAALFRRQGYAATGVKQILQVADVQPGSLYHHFPAGKHQLAEAVVDTMAAAIENQLRRALSSDLPALDVVEAAIDILIASLDNDERDGCPIEPIATESVNASSVVRAASAKAFRSWCAAIADRLRADGWRSSDADETAVAIVAQLEGALLLSRVLGDTTALMAAKPAVRALLR